VNAGGAVTEKVGQVSGGTQQVLNAGLTLTWVGPA
jgi:hypothetical protein